MPKQRAAKSMLPPRIYSHQDETLFGDIEFQTAPIMDALRQAGWTPSRVMTSMPIIWPTKRAAEMRTRMKENVDRSVEDATARQIIRNVRQYLVSCHYAVVPKLFRKELVKFSKAINQFISKIPADKSALTAVINEMALQAFSMAIPTIRALCPS